MSKQTDLWTQIDELAEKLGVSEWARRKWRQRNHVPYKWRLLLIEHSDGRLTARDFADEVAA